MGGPSSPTERLTTRRQSKLERLKHSITQLTLGQLLFLCVLVTFFLKITAGSDKASRSSAAVPFGGVAPVEEPQEGENAVVFEDVVQEGVVQEPKQLSWTELLETLPEHTIENGTRYPHPVPPSWPDPWPRKVPIASGWLSPGRFPPPANALQVDADSPANILRRREVGLGTLKVPDPAWISPQHEAASTRFFQQLVEQGVRVANASRGEAFDAQGNPVKIERVYDGRKHGWKGHIVRKGGMALPRVQIAVDPRTEEDHVTDLQRSEWVRRAFLHQWENYKRRAWGHDEVRPISGGGSDGLNGWGVTIFDSLGTLLLLGLDEEFHRARKHIATVDFSYLSPGNPLSYAEPFPGPMDVDRPGMVPANKLTSAKLVKLPDHLRSPDGLPMYETTVRYLGSLLSTYDLTHDPLMLSRAVDLAEWLLPAFGTKSGLVLSNLPLGQHPNGEDEAPMLSIAETGSLALEFTRLTQLTGEKKYFDAISRATDYLDKWHADQKIKGLFPIFVNASDPHSLRGIYGLGAGGGAYYQSLITQYQLLQGGLTQYKRMYEAAISSITKFMIRGITVVSGMQGLVSVGEMHYPPKEDEDDLEFPDPRYVPRLDQPAALTAAMLGLGAKLLSRPADLATAEKVINTYVWAFDSTRTGLAPEAIEFWSEDDEGRWDIGQFDGEQRKIVRGDPIGIRGPWNYHLHRPETAKSLFYLWRMTGDRRYQDQGWRMFCSWVEATISPGGFARFHDVNADTPRKDDSSVDSIVMSQTLRYYFLLFAPIDTLSLDDWVFNTEAHPLRIPKEGEDDPLERAPPLWKGEELAMPEGPIGQGSIRQKWARLMQAQGGNGVGGDLW